MKANIYTVNGRLAALEAFATEQAQENKRLRTQLEQCQKSLDSVQIIERAGPDSCGCPDAGDSVHRVWMALQQYGEKLEELETRLQNSSQ